MPHILYRCIFFVAILATCCSCADQSAQQNTAAAKDTLIGLRINFRPSFSDFASLYIDKTGRMVTFDVDIHGYRSLGEMEPFAISLDSFEAGTAIKLFYDTAFTNSIKKQPGRGDFDGIDISTLLVTANHTDTILAGNSFPQKLSDNLEGQIDFISNASTDKKMKTYCKDLKGYFH